MFRRTIYSAAVILFLGTNLPSSRADDQPPSRWPITVNVSEGQVTIFQPQLKTFENQTIITSHAAVSIAIPNQDEPVFGAIDLRDRVQTDPGAGTVTILDMTATAVQFPTDVGVTPEELSAALEPVSQQPIVLQLAQVQQLATVVQTEEATDNQLQAIPPKIIILQHRGVKVQYDGPPKLEETPDGLYRVVNTPFFVALDPESRTYFLKGGGSWFAAPDALGPFKVADTIPAGIVSLANSSGYTDPQQPVPPDEAENTEIITATEPTELIWTDGPPQFQTIPGTALLYWANTDSDFFVSLDNQQRYVLLSGRWFTSPRMKGPYTYIPPEQLPPDFAQIPPDSPKADVLSSIPGTPAAQTAVAAAEIPQATAVDTSDYDQPPVEYDGDPNFQPVQGTEVYYAVNTPYQIMRVRNHYYACYNAVWYDCDRPDGHWGICSSVPQDIYEIPPSCPDYSCRYVYVYGRRGSVVYVGYTSGYLGCYPHHGVVVYGTGYHYEPWEGHHYYSRPATFGYGAHYDRDGGGYGFSTGSALGGGDNWVGHPREDDNRPDPRQRFFGAGGFQQHQPQPRGGGNGQGGNHNGGPAGNHNGGQNGGPNVTINKTVIVTNIHQVNIYQRRPDAHPEVLTHPEVLKTGKPLPRQPRRQPPNNGNPPPPNPNPVVQPTHITVPPKGHEPNQPNPPGQPGNPPHPKPKNGGNPPAGPSPANPPHPKPNNGGGTPPVVPTPPTPPGQPDKFHKPPQPPSPNPGPAPVQPGQTPPPAHHAPEKPVTPPPVPPTPPKPHKPPGNTSPPPPPQPPVAPKVPKKPAPPPPPPVAQPGPTPAPPAPPKEPKKPAPPPPPPVAQPGPPPAPPAPPKPPKNPPPPPPPADQPAPKVPPKKAPPAPPVAPATPPGTPPKNVKKPPKSGQSVPPSDQPAAGQPG